MSKLLWQIDREGWELEKLLERTIWLSQIKCLVPLNLFFFLKNFSLTFYRKWMDQAFSLDSWRISSDQYLVADTIAIYPCFSQNHQLFRKLINWIFFRKEKFVSESC